MTLKRRVPVHCPPAAVCARNIVPTFHSNEFSLIGFDPEGMYIRKERFFIQE